MAGPIRITAPLLDVLEVFLQARAEGRELHGWAILKATGRAGPTIYGILDRPEDADWITGRWQDQPPDANTPADGCTSSPLPAPPPPATC
jgi:PadR family transcriptional regulator